MHLNFSVSNNSDLELSKQLGFDVCWAIHYGLLEYLYDRGAIGIIFAESLQMLCWKMNANVVKHFAIQIFQFFEHWRTYCHLLSDFASSVICKRLNLIKFYCLLFFYFLLKTFYANKIQISFISHKFFIIFHCHEIIHDLIFFTDLHFSAIFSHFT